MKQKYMQVALKEAKKAEKIDNVPVGCVIVYNNRIISKSYNRKEKTKICTHHAEILAIEKACKKTKDWRLENCELYVTLEPCKMCLEVIKQCRIPTIIYGTKNYKSIGNNYEDIRVIENILEHDCHKIIDDFFKKTRIEKKTTMFHVKH